MQNVQYTEKMEDLVFKWRELDSYAEDFKDLLEESLRNYRSFSAGLQMFVRRKSEEPVEDCFDWFKKACKANEVPLQVFGSVNTLKAWFGRDPDADVRPRHIAGNRKKIFAIAFALELSIEETAQLFHKVYFDRAFNHRRYEEVIYYFCLQKRLPYKTAEELIEKVDLACAEDDDGTLLTYKIAQDIDKLETTEDLLAYIFMHGHNFAIGTQSAKRVLQKVKQRALKVAQEESVEYISLYNVAHTRKKDGKPKKSLKKKDRELYQEANATLVHGRDTESDGFLYAAITRQRRRYTKEQKDKREKEGIKNTSKELMFNRAAGHWSIWCNFPKARSLSGAVDSFEELRKTIILLFSYQYWFCAEKNDIDNIYDDYCEEINDCLNEANLAPLYPGNLYDLLFLFCSSTDFPLAVFQEVLESFLERE